MGHIYSCRNIPVKVYIGLGQENEGSRRAKDRYVPLVRRQGGRGDELLRLGIQEFEGPQCEPARRSAGREREGHEWELPARGTGIHGPERRATVPVHGSHLAIRELREPAGGRRALGEAFRRRLEGPLRLAE